MAMLPWWIHYPNVNNEIINLDWILQVSNENTETIENFIGVNTIKYADPILWDITSQYEANTIVVDPQTGDAYISTKAVPYGVALSNTGYWTRIYNYASEIHTFREQIAADEQLSTTATAPRSVDDLVFLNGLLYIITAPMIAGDSYVVGSNCDKTTINAQLLRLHTAINAEAQTRSDADTAINTKIGDLANLNTTDKTSIVNAINEVDTDLANEVINRGNADTTLNNKIGDLANLNTTDKTSVVNAINETLTDITNGDTAIDNKIGSLASLNTTDKTSTVNAINEVQSGLIQYANQTDNTINKLTNRNFNKAIIVGDSWAIGYYDLQAHAGEGWGDYMAPLLGITSDNLLNVAEGGSGFINSSGVHFDQQILNAYNNYPAFRDADLIVCVGGFNDAQDNRTFNEVKQGCALFLTNVKNYFPNAECHIFPLQLPYKNAMTIERWTVLSAIKNAFYDMTDGNIFFHYGIHRWANEFGAGSDDGDNAHLNNYGYKYLGQKISECIKAQSDYYPTLTGTVDTTAWSAKIAATNYNSITEDNGVITMNLVLSTNATIDSTDGAITMPDFAVGVNDKYFFINNSALALWRSNGIQITSGSIPAGLIAIQMSFNAGD